MGHSDIQYCVTFIFLCSVLQIFIVWNTTHFLYCIIFYFFVNDSGTFADVFMPLHTAFIFFVVYIILLLCGLL